MPPIPGCPDALQQLVWDCTAANRRERWAWVQVLEWVCPGVRSDRGKLSAITAQPAQASRAAALPRALHRCWLLCPACRHTACATDATFSGVAWEQNWRAGGWKGRQAGRQAVAHAKHGHPPYLLTPTMQAHGCRGGAAHPVLAGWPLMAAFWGLAARQRRLCYELQGAECCWRSTASSSCLVGALPEKPSCQPAAAVHLDVAAAD